MIESKTAGAVYIVQHGDEPFFKIGMTNDLNHRLEDLQLGTLSSIGSTLRIVTKQSGCFTITLPSVASSASGFTCCQMPFSESKC